MTVGSFFLCMMTQVSNPLYCGAKSAFAFNMTRFKAYIKEAKLFIYYLPTFFFFFFFIASTKDRTLVSDVAKYNLYLEM